MRIKKYPDKNQYFLSRNGIWVRDFTLKGRSPIDINRLIRKEEYPLLIENELENFGKYTDVEDEITTKRNVVIVSDGFDFSKKHKLLASLPKDAAIIAVNKALSKWSLLNSDIPAEQRRGITYYVVNNPYPDCVQFLPKRYFPKCVTSIRTSPKFLDQYKGNIYVYSPSTDEHYTGPYKNQYLTVDDYRNPICAAISIAWKLRVENLLLLCCDDSFKHERPGAVKLENGLWCYPQQVTSSNLVDANLFWLANKGIRIANHSSGVKLEHAEYIDENGFYKFFEGSI